MCGVEGGWCVGLEGGGVWGWRRVGEIGGG